MQAPLIKTFSYNIHKGFNAGNRQYVLNHMREALHDLSPDLVFLQEVRGYLQPGYHPNWAVEPQFAYLAEAQWPHHAYGKNAVTAAGHHGNAILSKFPILLWENVDISTYELERRGLLHCVLDVPSLDHELHVICLHLNLFQRGRLKQIEKLCDRIETVVPPKAPLIIAGDFNDWQRQITSILAQRLQVQEAHQARHGRHARSFPAWMPVLSLDRIYFRGFRVENSAPLTGQPWHRLSDHVPLYSELLCLPFAAS
ncbi:MAG: endonuclease/exonuclease/phosphatase family protein [Acidobacteria bacterium]|nr:endonuclease/exonuclease/phosphatase family protein [Acidobacteriota bacterium]MCB9397533.1 endonuclease/exonuclease/phosphatase family protein [Acidobacteriota bacterium]